MRQEKFESELGEWYKDEELLKHRIMWDEVCTSYYKGIAKEVRQLIRSDSRIKNQFVEHTKQFMKMVDTYEAAFEKLRKPKKETYAPKDFPPDPRNWFIMRGRLSNLHSRTRKNIILQPDKTRPPTEQEHLMCCYVRLIVIHDCLCRLPYYTPIYFNQANNVPGRYFNVSVELWNRISYEIGDEIEKEAKELSDEALAAVKADLQLQADLAEKPAETEQSTTPAKRWWIKGFFWKLYEKTVKAFFDSYLGKSWPK